VAIAGTVQVDGAAEARMVAGRVDRLVVDADRVLVVDFKTDRRAPQSLAAVDEGYILQIALYAAVLGQIYPDRVIEAALVWTDGPRLMAVPQAAMAQALHDYAPGARPVAP
jgi:ATP-dependent helicase/nuclease subunit A